MELLIATRNAHKIEEIHEILRGSGLGLRSLAEFPELGELPETCETFEGNALQKARVAHEATGCLVVADDSGLEVDALHGAPGVHSKRFSPEATDEANNHLLLDRMSGHRERGARYRCVIAVVGADWIRTAEGRCEGTIALGLRGSGGFGYDPLFLPDEAPGRAMAELDMAEKNAIGHRGRAFRRLRELLPTE